MPSSSHDPSSRRIDLHSVDPNQLTAVLVPERRRGARPRPPKQRPAACHELAHAKRLRQIVVRATLEAHDLVGFLPPRRQHQDRDILVQPAVAHRTAQRQAVNPRNHEVEDEQIEALRLDPAERRPAVADSFAGVPFDTEVQRHELPDIGFVLDNQHARSVCHSFVTSRPSKGHRVAVQ